MSQPHTDLVNAIRLFISEIGGVSVPVDTPGLLYTRDGRPAKFGTKGALDIAATIKGRAVWIDAKIGRDRLKPAQVKFCRAQERAGAIAFAAWSPDDVRDRLRQEGLLDD
ncbi:hypothetical protein [Novosphingobium mathurense]|uniref:VRR-NUC domain-containing protein n=1 Tax=Novosphingobium mathurense TaxID=428990 RepID=A0A1U6I7B7_9SPHN|nr:hypothetical protein [Novosphingobium mathurense]SLK03904.1 hypothetical protein SAMN06295987_104303 [Novosphingobium mathurense]